MTGGPPLPGVLAEIEAVAGRAVALAVAAAFGGTYLYIPGADRIGSGGPLARAVGSAPARRIAAEIGGQRLYVPMARRARACQMAADGAAPGEIAARTGLSRVVVRRYLRDNVSGDL